MGVVVPPIDHECALLGVVAELSNQVEKLKYELAQLKKAHIGPKSERTKMPRVPTSPRRPRSGWRSAAPMPPTVRRRKLCASSTRYRPSNAPARGAATTS